MFFTNQDFQSIRDRLSALESVASGYISGSSTVKRVEVGADEYSSDNVTDDEHARLVLDVVNRLNAVAARAVEVGLEINLSAYRAKVTINRISRPIVKFGETENHD